MTVSTDLLNRFRAVSVLEDLPDDQLEWLAGECRVEEYAPGEAIFHEGDPPETMFFLLEGEFQAQRGKAEAGAGAFTLRTGDVGGMLPHSRLRKYPATARATVPTRIAHFPASRFPELLDRIPALEARLVAAMADRVREAERIGQRHVKLVSLGKLAAGLAHELNNPAAAVRRSAAELRKALDDVCVRTSGLARQVEPAVMDRLLEQRHELDPMSCARLDPLARSDREEAIAGWLAERGVPDAWEYAPTLTSAGAEAEWLECFSERLPAETVANAFGWLEATLRADELVVSVEQAARRVSELVGRVKQYTYMDQAPLQEIDVHEGLESTIQLLAHKLEHISVVRDYAPELPHIPAYGAELNQVWTNLLDNAAAAVGTGGEIRLRTRHDGECVCIEVQDNGPGVPAEIQERVFEPFFTTKDVGQGTGLGLDIARRIVEQHHGSIRLFSEPGSTRFVVRLPLRASSAQ
jgi:signal transduction histidine kinase